MTPAEMVAAFKSALISMLESRVSLGQDTDLAEDGVRNDIANNLAQVAVGAIEEAVEAAVDPYREKLAAYRTAAGGRL